VSRPAQIPTLLNEQAAWERHAAIAREVIDNPRLLLDRAYCERHIRAWAEWRDLFLARDKQC
jgi:hypothetical protein